MFYWYLLTGIRGTPGVGETNQRGVRGREMVKGQRSHQEDKVPQPSCRVFHR